MNRIIFLASLFISLALCMSVHAQTSTVESCKVSTLPILGTTNSVIRLPVPDPRLKEKPVVPEIQAEQICVEIIINKKGRVISAHALAGNLLLQDQAAKSAMRMRFDPKRKLTKGLLVFNFTPILDPKVQS